MLGTEGIHVVHVGPPREYARDRYPESVQRLRASTNLSWAMAQRVRARRHHRYPSATSRPQVLVGTCSWSNGQRVTAHGDSAQRVEVVGRPRTTSADQRRRLVRTGGQHPQRLTERDSGLVGHSGQLVRRRSWPLAATGSGLRSRHLCCHGHGRPTWPLICTGNASVALLRRLPPVSFADATIARLPRPIRPFAERHHELIKFAIVGGTTFVIDSAIFFTLKLTVLEPKPVTAKIIAGVVAVIASYILNREWSFRDRGGRERITKRCSSSG